MAKKILKSKIGTSEIRRELGGIPRKFSKAVMGVLKKTGEAILRTLRKPGLKPTYPIPWDTQKQKRFVMGYVLDEIPYKRTKQTREAWKMSASSQNLIISNKKKHAVFLYGSVTGSLAGAVHVLPTGQSHIHEERYPLVYEVIKKNTENLANRIIFAMRRIK